MKTSLYKNQNYEQLNDWSKLNFTHPKLGKVVGKIFLREDLGLSGMEVSLNSLPEGVALPFSHAHKQNEELYLFLSGAGEMLIDGERIKVQSGSAVRISPQAFRTLRALNQGALNFIVIQVKEKSLEQASLDDGIMANEQPNWH